MFNRRSFNNSRRISRRVQFRRPLRSRNLKPNRDMLPPMYAKRWPTPSLMIPSYTDAPAIKRVVRIEGTFTSTSPSLAITANQLAQLDATYYTNTTNLRYDSIRVYAVRLYVETYNVTSTTPAIGATLTDTDSQSSFAARPVSGSSYAAVGMYLSRKQAENITACSDTTYVIFTASTDIAIPPSSQVRFTCDVYCEFN